MGRCARPRKFRRCGRAWPRAFPPVAVPIGGCSIAPPLAGRSAHRPSGGVAHAWTLGAIWLIFNNIMTNLLSLKEIESEVNNLARLINAPKDYLPTFGYTNDFAQPHIEINYNQYHYVIVERGQEFERKSTENIHELLYWIFESITFNMAIDYEFKNRIEDLDSRRIAFKKQEELLNLLNPDWKNTLENKHKLILEKHPFDDLSGLRATYCRELREKGYCEDDITKKAYEKYPLP